jgi:hypothetical protein
VPYIALGLLLLVGLLALGHLFVRANPRTLAKVLKLLGIAAAAFVALVLIVTGRAASLIGIAPLLLFAFLGWKQASRRRAAAARSRRATCACRSITTPARFPAR